MSTVCYMKNTKILTVFRKAKNLELTARALSLSFSSFVVEEAKQPSRRGKGIQSATIASINDFNIS